MFKMSPYVYMYELSNIFIIFDMVLLRLDFSLLCHFLFLVPSFITPVTQLIVLFRALINLIRFLKITLQRLLEPFFPSISKLFMKLFLKSNNLRKPVLSKVLCKYGVVSQWYNGCFSYPSLNQKVNY